MLFSFSVISIDYRELPEENILFAPTNPETLFKLHTKNQLIAEYGTNALKNRIDYSSKKEVEKWLKTTTYEKLATYLKSTATESRAIECQEKEWGYTFLTLTAFDAAFLQEIARLYDEIKIRPRVLDLGSGYSYIAPLILAAGGEYRGVEHLLNVADSANREIWRWRNLWTLDGENSKDLYKIHPSSILNDKLKFTDNNKDEIYFDIVICKNVLHFYQPHECDKLIAKIYNWLKKDGTAYILAESPHGKKSWMEFYESNKNPDNLYPGFGIQNSPLYTYLYCFDFRMTRSSIPSKLPPFVEEEDLMVSFPKNSDLSPALSRDGFIDQSGELILDHKQKSEYFEIVRSDTRAIGRCITLTSWSHIISNFFTAQQLADLFGGNGFSEAEHFNIDSYGTNMTDGPINLIHSKAGLAIKKR